MASIFMRASSLHPIADEGILVQLDPETRLGRQGYAAFDDRQLDAA
jgi:hypothetical protein